MPTSHITVKEDPIQPLTTYYILYAKKLDVITSATRSYIRCFGLCTKSPQSGAWYIKIKAQHPHNIFSIIQYSINIQYGGRHIECDSTDLYIHIFRYCRLEIQQEEGSAGPNSKPFFLNIFDSIPIKWLRVFALKLFI
jgi:hypothetical protein